MGNPVIHYYQHAEGGAVHGFTHPLAEHIANQVKAGELTRVADPNGTDMDDELARLRAENARLAKLAGVETSAPEPGLADTGSGDEPRAEASFTIDDSEVVEAEPEPDEFGDLPPDPDDESAGDELHLCLECGEPVQRKGKTGPWPQKHPECK